MARNQRNLCCEELMTNIAKHSHGHVVHHSFDVHIYSDDKVTCVALKDGGSPSTRFWRARWPILTSARKAASIWGCGW